MAFFVSLSGKGLPIDGLTPCIEDKQSEAQAAAGQDKNSEGEEGILDAPFVCQDSYHRTHRDEGQIDHQAGGREDGRTPF